MRFHTAISATRKSAPDVSINIPPNAAFPPEVHVSVGGLSLWLEEAEATLLGQQLIDAGIRIRAERRALAEPGHDRDRDGICSRCGHGITALEILDGEKPCTPEGESDAHR